MKTIFTNSPILCPLISAVLLFVFFITPNTIVNGQIDIDIEKIKEKCKDKPIEDRIRVTVARFNVTSRSRKANASFGDELATIATNVLQNVNCFTVLARLADMNDMTDELEMGQSKFIDQDAAASMGKMQGAQAVFTGEITEFEQNDVGGGVVGLSIGTNKTNVGFVLRLIDIESRRVIWSESVNATGRTPGAQSGLKLLGEINIAGGKKKGQSLSDDVERGIIKTLYTLADNLDNYQFPQVKYIDLTNTELFTLNIENSNFSKVRTLRKLLNTNEKIHSVKQEEVRLDIVKQQIAKSRGIKDNQVLSEEATALADKKAILTIRHEGDVDQFMDLLDAVGANMFEISNQHGSVVEITMK